MSHSKIRYNDFISLTVDALQQYYEFEHNVFFELANDDRILVVMTPEVDLNEIIKEKVVLSKTPDITFHDIKYCYLYGTNEDYIKTYDNHSKLITKYLETPKVLYNDGKVIDYEVSDLYCKLTNTNAMTIYPVAKASLYDNGERFKIKAIHTLKVSIEYLISHDIPFKIIMRDYHVNSVCIDKQDILSKLLNNEIKNVYTLADVLYLDGKEYIPFRREALASFNYTTCGYQTAKLIYDKDLKKKPLSDKEQECLKKAKAKEAKLKVLDNIVTPSLEIALEEHNLHLKKDSKGVYKIVLDDKDIFKRLVIKGFLAEYKDFLEQSGLIINKMSASLIERTISVYADIEEMSSL